MELYYKDLISEEASLEKLVDDLLKVVQGVDEFAQATGATLKSQQKEEVTSRLQKLKEGCSRVRQQAVESAAAADRMVHRNPYSVAGIAFGIGLLGGALLCHSLYRRKARD